MFFHTAFRLRTSHRSSVPSMPYTYNATAYEIYFGTRISPKRGRRGEGGSYSKPMDLLVHTDALLLLC